MYYIHCICWLDRKKCSIKTQSEKTQVKMYLFYYTKIEKLCLLEITFRSIIITSGKSLNCHQAIKCISNNSRLKWNLTISLCVLKVNGIAPTAHTYFQCKHQLTQLQYAHWSSVHRQPPHTRTNTSRGWLESDKCKSHALVNICNPPTTHFTFYSFKKPFYPFP